jgi:hypothetical protein
VVIEGVLTAMVGVAMTALEPSIANASAQIVLLQERIEPLSCKAESAMMDWTANDAPERCRITTATIQMNREKARKSLETGYEEGTPRLLGAIVWSLDISPDSRTEGLPLGSGLLLRALAQDSRY